MPSKSLSAVLAATAAVTITASPAFGGRLIGHEYLKEARISLATARATALKTYPGTIVTEELEKEKGGSGLRYSFDIRHRDATREIGVDARTGAVLEDSAEGDDRN